MVARRLLAVVAVVGGPLSAHGFGVAPARGISRATPITLRGGACMRPDEDDPTASPIMQAVNWLSQSVQQSPVAGLKKGLAKLQAGDYDEATTRAELDALIADNPVMVFSFTTCPFCLRAKQLLDGMGANYKAVELDAVPGGFAYRAELAQRTGRTSVPAVFIGGEFAGGCNDGGLGGVVALDNQGKLRPMLSKVGALAA